MIVISKSACVVQGDAIVDRSPQYWEVIGMADRLLFLDWQDWLCVICNINVIMFVSYDHSLLLFLYILCVVVLMSVFVNVYCSCLYVSKVWLFFSLINKKLMGYNGKTHHATYWPNLDTWWLLFLWTKKSTKHQTPILDMRENKSTKWGSREKSYYNTMSSFFTNKTCINRLNDH